MTLSSNFSFKVCDVEVLKPDEILDQLAKLIKGWGPPELMMLTAHLNIKIMLLVEEEDDKSRMISIYTLNKCLWQILLDYILL